MHHRSMRCTVLCAYLAYNKRMCRADSRHDMTMIISFADFTDIAMGDYPYLPLATNAPRTIWGGILLKV